MKNIIPLICMFMLMTSHCNAQIVDVNFNGAGVTSYSAWSNVNAFNYAGYGSFPGNAPWPAPIAATEGSSTASVNRIAGSPTGGGPFLASESIYFGNFAQTPNALGGTLRIFDDAPIFNLKTLVFQIQIGEATGFDFHQPSGMPQISLNNAPYAAATFTNLVNRFQNGTFPSPTTGQEEPVYVNTWAFQWNVASNAFDTLAIDFSAVTHAQVYAMRMDGTSVLQSAPVIPEPSVFALLVIAAAGAAGHMIRNRKR